MGADERTLRTHLEAAPFRSGAARGNWRLVEIAWPRVVIAVAAAERDGAPAAYEFGFDCTNYPTHAPTASPWNAATGTRLEHTQWPGGTDRVQNAFGRGDFVYLPCDRQALNGHADWLTRHRHMLWTPESDITLYLGLLHDLLHSPHYRGRRGG
jgi:hypothetical protein